MPLEIHLICQGHPLWERTIAFARNSSWRAGPFLARKMEAGEFQPWERVIAAVEDGEVIGYCTFTEQDELPERYGYAPFLGFVYVDEDHRGRRISQRMIDCAIVYAKTLGYPAVYLMSGEHGLYEKYGFEKLGEFETIWGTVDQLYRKATGS